jgi:hypothetical protein
VGRKLVATDQYLHRSGCVVLVFVVPQGWEYAILPMMLQDGSINLIDELFVEIHYNDPGR